MFGPGEFVGLGQQHQKFQALGYPWPNHIEQDFVEFGETVAGVAHQHNGAQILPRDQVVGHHLLPAYLVLLGHCGIAVAGQVGQHGVGQALLTQREQVDVLGTTGFFGCKSELFLLRQGVDAGRFPGVGAADEGKFGHAEGRQEVQLWGGGEEPRGVQPAAGHEGGSRGRTRCGVGGAARWGFGVVSHSV